MKKVRRKRIPDRCFLRDEFVAQAKAAIAKVVNEDFADKVTVRVSLVVLHSQKVFSTVPSCLHFLLNMP